MPDGPRFQVPTLTISSLLHRAECAASVKVWRAVDDALDTKNWDVNDWNQDTQRVFSSLIGFCINLSGAIGQVVNKEPFLAFFVE